MSVAAGRVRAVSMQITDRPSDADVLRAAMVQRLRQRGALRSDLIAQAFRTVPRHLFAGDVPLEDAYDEESVVRIKYGADGACISSVSAPNAQAVMLEMAGIERGDRVVEYGSGGYNAALLAELVGPTGRVTTVDIDPEVTDRASRCLERAGYSRVRVTLADAEAGVDGGPFDKAMVTFGAWDIPAAWVEQLAGGGSLAVPLRIAGLTRVIAFVRDGGGLVSTAHEMFGFVPAQGAGSHPAPTVGLAPGIALEFDDGFPDDPRALARALRSPRAEAWSGVTTPGMTPFDLLHLWLAFTLPGVCKVRVAAQRAAEADCPVREVMGPAASRSGSFAYLTCRRLDEREPSERGVWEFGARGFGPHACEVADLVVAEVRTWNASYRHAPAPRIIARRADLPAEPPAVGVEIVKRHMRISTVWG